MVRPAPSAHFTWFKGSDQLALPNPGIASEECITSPQCLIHMCISLLFVCVAADQSVTHAAARAGARWRGEGRSQAWA